jgi:hypothetical protein
MRRALIGVCVAATAAIVAEFWMGAGSADPATLVAASRPAEAGKASAGSAGSQSDVEHWAAVALARPMFAPDRRPVGGVAAVQSGLPRLAGVIVSPDDQVAIFQTSGAAKPVTIRKGATLNGWLVTGIEADGVSLWKSDASLVVRPEFMDARAGGSAARKDLPKSRWEEAAPTGMLRARWSNPQLQP